MKASRNTIQRDLVLQAVRALHHHPTAEEIYQETVKHHPNISKGTVYRNLNLLAQRGDILKVELPDGADRFDFKVAGHHHAHCRLCGSVYDMDIPQLAEVLDIGQEVQGFQIETCQVLFRGVCPNCRQKEKTKNENDRRNKHE